MLANMVKRHYGETPVFLDVASVINPYAVESQANAQWTWVHPVASIGDTRSVRLKQLFTFLVFVFSLTETEGREGAVIVTIPAG
jgi:hypothetical protein